MCMYRGKIFGTHKIKVLFVDLHRHTHTHTQTNNNNNNSSIINNSNSSNNTNGIRGECVCKFVFIYSCFRNFFLLLVGLFDWVFDCYAMMLWFVVDHIFDFDDPTSSLFRLFFFLLLLSAFFVCDSAKVILYHTTCLYHIVLHFRYEYECVRAV